MGGWGCWWGANLDGDVEGEGGGADGGAGVTALVPEGEHHQVRAAVDHLVCMMRARMHHACIRVRKHVSCRRHEKSCACTNTQLTRSLHDALGQLDNARAYASHCNYISPQHSLIHHAPTAEE